ncbi:Methionyl-tRNA formyltransferase [Bacteroides coprosuis DSM 18011]|uniref:Methionyl-tRNA formyltransferase n=1 Tax=Bacteroides coprosuis DSM 18011 TaxID=679937 RepID=F3ZPI5_9BACE|nr:methionyl-tRNA formyltransferase [Bacteroides coprosuis]EGJ70344.1 Methionyl-tRNA formyltransferase [Bacteroides coprosuis DSM 18011]
MDKKTLRIIYMGTPEFAVESLKELVENEYNVVAVVTMPDKPAGRGHKIQYSDVKKYALSQHLPILQPSNLKDEAFIEELKSYKADLQIVVAFRMLPEVVWDMPRLGTFNLHASLLPQYRGAAPINWAIINGDKETGVTTFFLEHEIDTGKIIMQEKVAIGENDSVGEIHDKLMILGGKVVTETVDRIIANQVNPLSQSQIIENECIEMRPAPKIFKETCEINWDQPLEVVHNFIRGLSPYPAAWSTLTSTSGESWKVKIFKTRKVQKEHNIAIGSVFQEGREDLKIAVQGGYLDILEMQLPGKRRMPIADLLRGFDIDSSFKMN